MLQEGLVTPERMAKVYAELARESSRMARLVDNVLEASRLESGKRELHATHGDLSEAAAHVVNEHRASAEARGMTLRFESAGPVESSFDEATLERILANLIDNAIKYAEGSEDPSVSVTVASTPAGATLQVRDHGPGIDPAERERVFERFHRVGRESDAHRPGTGLGLALVRELARAHGGDARVEAPPGGGAMVTVVLPSLPTG
jgi:signal transduction histidine kinase